MQDHRTLKVGPIRMFDCPLEVCHSPKRYGAQIVAIGINFREEYFSEYNKYNGADHFSS